ncbi:MAG TPA: magnesium transporter CorA family protein [Streptosporangiaceae bacterium]|nr:magnesium transporter CorA family protein [Streptosporangiaceae bacterium]
MALAQGLTDHRDDPSAGAVCSSTPTRCQARTRVYREGKLLAEGFPVADISEYLEDEAAIVWLDLLAPDRDDLMVLSEEFGLHPLAIEDAIHPHERTKIDRYHSHLFLAAYAVHLDQDSGELMMKELAAFVTSRALITVRKDEDMNIGAVVSYWDGSPDLAAEGVGYLLHGLLDNIVDGYFTAVQSLDDEIERLEDLLFAETLRDQGAVQRRSFELRKSLVLFRRVVLPMREVVNTVMRRDLHLVTDRLQPYYQDVYDHALRATEWTESLRDLVNTILETNLTVQSNRMNVITKKVTSWAAIIAVPTLVTGIYGMNVPYPGFGKMVGFELSFSLMVVVAVILYFVFKRRDWL